MVQEFKSSGSKVQRFEIQGSVNARTFETPKPEPVND